MTLDPINWRRTGGTVGRARRFPTFTVEQAENGCWTACDDTQGGRITHGGYRDLDRLAAHLAPIIRRRIGHWEYWPVSQLAQLEPEYRTDLTPAGEQTVIPGCEKDASPSVRQLELF